MYRGWLGSVVLFLALALVAGCGNAGGEGKDAHGGESQPNPVSIKYDLGIWTLVVFGLLFLALRKVAWGPMLEGLHKREQGIRDAIAEAQKAREEAQQLRAQFRGEMDRAQEKVHEIMEAARNDARRLTEEMTTKARGEIQTERERLHREIELAKDQALQELWNQTAQLATLVSAKAIRRHLNADDHRRLVDEAIAELRQADKKMQREVVSV
jgi:F-type H+-transporting ATPase subunit b